MQQGTQVEIESALLKIYPEQGTYFGLQYLAGQPLPIYRR